jgi:hypothetical protein
MTKFDLRKAILENKATFHSSLKEDMGLTPFQQEIYDFEEEISGEDFAAEEIDNIRGLNNIDDVENYYANYRGWEDDSSLNGILRDLIRGLAKQFPDLAEVKSSLNEGQFSWFTQDTDQQIGSEPENTLRAVYMFDNKGNKWVENRYEGYGDFGGKDYYELLAQMNGMANPDRSEGISLAFSGKKGILYPALVTNPNFNWKMHDFTEEAKHDPDQSWYAGEEDEDEYIMGDRDDEYLEEGDTEFQRVAKGKKNKVAKNKGEEDVYGAGVKKGEEIEKKKMKVSELKAKIKEMVLAEVEFDVENPSKENSLYDFMNEADEEVDAEATDTETADAELETPEGTEDVEVTDTMTTAEVDPNVKSVQDALTQAQAAAEQLGDKKLMDQIGNTITFFTRTHVVEKPGLSEGEEKELEEGVWAFLPNRVSEFVKAVEDLKDEYHGVVGDDDIFDHLDGAIRRAEELRTAYDNKPKRTQFTIPANENKMEDKKESSMKIKEVTFPMWTKLNK